MAFTFDESTNKWNLEKDNLKETLFDNDLSIQLETDTQGGKSVGPHINTPVDNVIKKVVIKCNPHAIATKKVIV